jgi:hypothetical protein
VRVAGACLLALILLGACSDDESASSTTVAETLGSTGTGATTPVTDPADSGAPTSASTSTTGLPETTAAPVTDPPVSEGTAFPPSPTVIPSGDPRADIEAAYNAGKQLWLGCFAALSECDLAKFPEAYSGQALEVGTRLVSQLQVGGYQATRIADYREYILDISVVDSHEAIVRICRFDPVRIARPATETQAEDVFSDAVVSAISEITMVLGSDGVWRNDHPVEIERVEGGASLCSE